jgi:hypothetical protein
MLGDRKFAVAEDRMAQIGHADIKTTHTYYVAGLADAQLRAVDAIEAAFLAPLLGKPTRTATSKQ